MRPESTRAMLAVQEVLHPLPEDDRRAIVYELYRTYGGPLTGMSKAAAGRLGGMARAVAGGLLGDQADAVLESAPAPVVKASSSSLCLSEAALEASRKKLDAADFDFLAACPEPFRTQWLRDPEWWISLKDAYPRLHHQQEASRCMAYVQGKFSPAQMQRHNLKARLRQWFAKAEMWRENRMERQAVRR